MSETQDDRAEAEASAVPPMHIEQADHVELIQKVAAMRLARAHLELARCASLDADAACVEVERRLQAKYQTSDADQYAADGTIWRKGANA